MTRSHKCIGTSTICASNRSGGALRYELINFWATRPARLKQLSTGLGVERYFLPPDPTWGGTNPHRLHCRGSKPREAALRDWESKMVKQAKDLNVLFYETLKDIYFAEKQILRALPKMAKSAESDELRTAFETHRDQTEGH